MSINQYNRASRNQTPRHPVLSLDQTAFFPFEPRQARIIGRIAVIGKSEPAIRLTIGARKRGTETAVRVQIRTVGVFETSQKTLG